MKAPLLAARLRRWNVSRCALLLRLLVAAPIIGASGCAGAPGRPWRTSAESAQQQAAQTRRFDGITQPEMLTACAALLQDLGFTIETGDSKLGLLIGSKQHTAEVKKKASEVVLEVAATVALALAFAALTGSLALGSSNEDPADRQVIRVTLQVNHGTADNPARVSVNVAMDRVVYTRNNHIRHQESVHDPVLIQALFEALSKSVFLEAHSP
jgi:hypothetical protein